MRPRPWSRTTAATAGLAVACTYLAVTAPAASATDTDTSTGPKNVIVLIGDGMGYNTVDLTSLYQYGTTDHQVVVDPSTGSITQVPGTASQVFESFDVQTSMTTYSQSTINAGYTYDPTAAWSDFSWVKNSATDSAAAATALATGSKTTNGVLGYDTSGTKLENLTERADALGKATGIVTSVPFSHATPAGYAAHNTSRNDYAGITTEYLDSDYLDVVMGASNPFYDDDHQLLTTPDYTWVSENDWTRLESGQTGFTLIQDTADFEDLATASTTPDRVFGAAQVATTLQEGRTGAVSSAEPYSVALNDVPTLETMTKGALNVLEEDPDGFFVMIEGGAIDWSGHADSTSTVIEETVDFNRSVEAVVDWVESESSWDDTLVIVTADHETGYLAGPGANPTWTELTGTTVGTGHSWNSGSHTNQLVGVWAQGAGADTLAAAATGTDPVRGSYLDNTDLAKVLLDDLWSATPSAGEGDVTVSATVPEKVAGTGALTLSVAADSVALGSPVNDGDRMRFTGGLPTVSVTDSRDGDYAGWTLSGQASDLVSDSPLISAKYLGWTPSVVSGRTGVTAGEQVVGLLDSGAGLSSSAVLASADATGRFGTTLVGAELDLSVPVTTQAGTYTGALTVSLFPVD